MRTASLLLTGAVTLFIVAPAGAQEPVRAGSPMQIPRQEPAGALVALDDFGASGRAHPSDVIKRLLSLDKDGDGNIARAEFPERMQGVAERADSDRDGIVTRQEVERFVRVAASARPSPAPSGPRKTATMADIVSDLRLPQPKHDRAMALAKNYTGGVRHINNSRELSWDDLFGRMRQLLDDEEYGNFVAAANRLKSGGQVFLQGVVVK